MFSGDAGVEEDQDGVEEDQDEGGGNQARYHHSTADHVDSTINYRRFSFILGKFPIFFW